jgi:hypothetical protein
MVEEAQHVPRRATALYDPVADCASPCGRQRLRNSFVRRIATHAKPDPDAIVAAWLAATFLFPGEEAEVAFVPRTRPGQPGAAADCLVDITCTHDPQRLIFDHKPPAFADRNATCATRLIWEHLTALGRPVGHLEALVRVVHEGDRSPPARPSAELARSRADGLHAHFARMRGQCSDDHQLYRAVRSWLDHYDADHREPPVGFRECQGLTPIGGRPRIRVDRELAQLVPPLAPEPLRELEARLIEEGVCRDPLVVWAGRGILLSGHDRYAICRRRGLTYGVAEIDLTDRQAALRWVITDQLTRRDLSPIAVDYLCGMRLLVEADAALKGALAERRRRAGGWLEGLSYARGSAGHQALQSLAREFGIDEPQMRADARLAEAVEVIARNCGVDALRLMLVPGDRLKRDVILSIARKGPERQRYAMGRAAQGRAPLDRPEDGIWPMDTRNFAKVVSRLGRALGHVDACVAATPSVLKAKRPTREEGDAIRSYLEGIIAGSQRLLALVEGRGTAESARGKVAAGSRQRSCEAGGDQEPPTKSIAQVKGQLDVAWYFIEKTARDVPRMPPGERSTPRQLEKIRHQLQALIERSRELRTLFPGRRLRRRAV